MSANDTAPRWNVNKTRDLVEIVPGVFAPLLLIFSGPLLAGDKRSQGFTVHGDAVLLHEGYVLRELAVSAPLELSVNGVALRQVAPETALREAAGLALVWDEQDESIPQQLREYLAQRRDSRSLVRSKPFAGPTPAAIETVALIYKVADMTGDAPAKAVTATLGLAQRTAANWIATARKNRLL